MSAEIFIQWKGTNVCLDFTCECGASGHLDGDFVYALRCGDCGREWAMPCAQEPLSIPLAPLIPNPYHTGVNVEVKAR